MLEQLFEATNLNEKVRSANKLHTVSLSVKTIYQINLFYIKVLWN